MVNNFSRLISTRITFAVPQDLLILYCRKLYAILSILCKNTRILLCIPFDLLTLSRLTPQVTRMSVVDLYRNLLLQIRFPAFAQ